MSTNTPDKDPMETWVRHLVLDKGYAIKDIISPFHALEMRKTLKAYLTELQQLKASAMITSGIGGICGLSGVMIAAPWMMAAGFGVAVTAAIATIKRADAQVFAALDEQALEKNSQILQVLAEFEGKNLLSPADLVSVWDTVFHESIRGDFVATIVPENFKEELYRRANASIVGFEAAGQFESSMTTRSLDQKLMSSRKPKFEDIKINGPQAVEAKTVEPFTLPTVAPTEPTQKIISGVAISEISSKEPLALPTVAPTEPIKEIIPEVAISKVPTKGKPVKPNALATLQSVIQQNSSCFIFGIVASGKGTLAANLLRWKLDQYPNSTAFVLDSKGDKKEKGYWEHKQIQISSFRGGIMDSSTLNEKVIEWMTTARDYMAQTDIVNGKRLFLVVDDFLFLEENLDKEVLFNLVKLLSNCVSTGDSEGIHAIVLTQYLNGNNIWSNNLIKNLCLIGIFRGNNYAGARELFHNSKVAINLIESAEFDSMIKESPCNRVGFIGGKFFPMPELENHSGFDRDLGTMIQPAKELSQ